MVHDKKHYSRKIAYKWTMFCCHDFGYKQGGIYIWTHMFKLYGLDMTSDWTDAITQEEYDRNNPWGTEHDF